MKTRTPAEKLQHKLDRLATPGYYVEYIIDGGKPDLAFHADYPCTVFFIGQDAKCKYARGQGWGTLTWSCAPTKNMAANGQGATHFEYYATWDDLVQNCTLPISQSTKCPTDPN